MARQRFIWPQLWDDPDLGELDDAARLLYIGCFSLADDEGRILGDPVYLKSAIFKYRSVSTDRVLRLRNELVKVCRHFHVYKVRQIEYIVFQNWASFQKPKYPTPSKHPPPPATRVRVRKPAAVSQTDSGNDSGKPPGTLGEVSGNDSPTGREGLGSTGLDLLEINPLAVDAARDEASRHAHLDTIANGKQQRHTDLNEEEEPEPQLSGLPDFSTVLKKIQA